MHVVIIRERQKAITLSRLFSWFILYSSIGWVYETILCYFTTGRYINRGFLYGPICPIYGFSILIMIVLLTDRCRNIITLFLSCSLITTALEYISSYWMEVVFNKRWWDYSDRFLNLNGRICFSASVLFGLCGVVFVRWIHPAIAGFLNNNISDTQLRKANIVIFTLLLFDILISFYVQIN